MSSNPYTIGKLTRTRSDGSRYWSFCIIWYEGNQRRRVSLGTTDRVTADALARKLWAGLRGGAVETVGEVVEGYLNSLNGTKDEARKRNGWKQASPYWATVKIANVDRQMSLDYPAWRSRSINTVRNELSCIRSAFIWAAGQTVDQAGTKMISAPPPIVVPAMPASKVDHLTKPQFRKFLEGCGMPHVRLFAILAVTTGARKGALLEAKWDQVDWGRMTLDLNPQGREQKGNKTRATVALNDRAMQALREAKDGAVTEYIIEYRCGPIADIKKGIAAASTRSGVFAHPHMFRHSAAVWMAEDRVPMPEIAAFLGHKDMNITIGVYARYHPDYLRKAADSLTW